MAVYSLVAPRRICSRHNKFIIINNRVINSNSNNRHNYLDSRSSRRTVAAAAPLCTNSTNSPTTVTTNSSNNSSSGDKHNNSNTTINNSSKITIIKRPLNNSIKWRRCREAGNSSEAWASTARITHHTCLSKRSRCCSTSLLWIRIISLHSSRSSTGITKSRLTQCLLSSRWWGTPSTVRVASHSHQFSSN